MAGYDASKIFLRGQYNLASGLTNGVMYALLPGGNLLSLSPDNPLSATSTVTFPNAGMRDGNGLYHLPADARQLFLGLATLNAMTGAVGCTFNIWASMAQPWVTRCAAFGNPIGVALSNGVSLGSLIPIVPGSPQNLTGAAGSFCPEWFIPTVTATTWPSSGGLLDFHLACY